MTATFKIADYVAQMSGGQWELDPTAVDATIDVDDMDLALEFGAPALDTPMLVDDVAIGLTFGEAALSMQIVPADMSIATTFQEASLVEAVPITVADMAFGLSIGAATATRAVGAMFATAEHAPGMVITGDEPS